ncbi:hypothetical protein LCGC14_2735430, partial [marine sediment metagenome]
QLGSNHRLRDPGRDNGREFPDLWYADGVEDGEQQ